MYKKIVGLMLIIGCLSYGSELKHTSEIIKVASMSNPVRMQRIMRDMGTIKIRGVVSDIGIDNTDRVRVGIKANDNRFGDITIFLNYSENEKAETLDFGDAITIECNYLDFDNSAGIYIYFENGVIVSIN